MTLETSREDLYDVSSGTTGKFKLFLFMQITVDLVTVQFSNCLIILPFYSRRCRSGVGGRMAKVLTDAGIPTNLFSINGQQMFLTGELGSGPTQYILNSNGLTAFNAEPSIANMNDVIKTLNNENTADSGFHAETWSSKLSESLNRQKSLKEKVDLTNVTTLFPLGGGISDQFKLVTRLMQTRESRGSKRDIFYVQDGGYDTHGEFNAYRQAYYISVFNINLHCSQISTVDSTLWYHS
jgi:hypothetical protein